MNLNNTFIFNLIITLIIVIISAYIFYNIINISKVSHQNNIKEKTNENYLKYKINDLEKKIDDLISLNDNQNDGNINIKQDETPNMFNPIIEFDRRKLLDPFIDPSTRPPASQVPTPQIASLTNIATQNIYDSYHRIGLLIEDGNKSNHENLNHIENFNLLNNENSILELMGRLLYHNFYQYFTSISMGNKVIKINIKRENGKELYNGDKIFIPELNKLYNVTIDRRDMIYYNPYFPNPI